MNAGPMRQSHLRLICFALAAIAVAAYDLWAVRATGEKFEWGYDLTGYYDLLGRAFAGGHLYLPIQPSPQLLAQPNPWDPAVDPSLKWHDMVLYGGRYYLYFGPAPAVLLFTPWRLATGHDLPENFAIFLLCFAGFLFSCGSLLRIFELSGAAPGPLTLSLLLLSLGLCQSVPFLLNRVAVYEIAIAGGYFCLSAAVYFLARGIRSNFAPYWLAASGLMFGGAVASRPHLIFGAMVAAGGLLYLGRWRSRQFAAFALALVLAGAAIGTYNYERFGNPWEFGFRYQLAGPGQNRVGLSTANLVPGMYFMLLSRPELSPVFPWMRMVFRYPFDSAERHPLPTEYFVEPSVGALWLAPFLPALLLPIPRKAAIESRALVRIAALSSLAVLLFLISTHLATQRYEVDFLPLGVLAAAAALEMRMCWSAGVRRVLWTAAAVALMAWSAVANLALGIAGSYDDLLGNRPYDYVRIARWFSPVRAFRPMINPPVHVELEAAFVPEPAGLREPLVTIGHSHYHHFLYVEHAAGVLRVVSQSANSRLVSEMPDPGRTPVRFGLDYSPATHVLTASVNGKPVLSHAIPMLVTAPAEIDIGRNVSDAGLTARRCDAAIHVLRKTTGE
jgi:hypothetical protein